MICALSRADIIYRYVLVVDMDNTLKVAKLNTTILGVYMGHILLRSLNAAFQTGELSIIKKKEHLPVSRVSW